MIPIGDGNGAKYFRNASHKSIETDMIPIGDGNYCLRPLTLHCRIETDMIPIGDGNFFLHFFP